MTDISNKKERILVVFLRNPLLGKVKRRIARVVGDKEAYDIYIDLIVHTKSICDTLACDRAVFYSDFIDHSDMWSNQSYFKFLQSGKDIGERMYNVFKELIEGYKKVVLIGTDIPGISQRIINNSFNELNSSDMVLGPAKDGGYYLIGMKSIFREIFIDKEWGTGTVLNNTIQNLKEKNKTFSLLDKLGDVDTVNDLGELKLINKNDKSNNASFNKN